MAGIFFGFSYGGSGDRGRRDGTGTADGGKQTPLDLMIDSAGPVTAPPVVVTPEARAEHARRKAAMAKLGAAYDPKIEEGVAFLRREEEAAKMQVEDKARRFARRSFQVTSYTRRGGSGLFGSK